MRIEQKKIIYAFGGFIFFSLLSNVLAPYKSTSGLLFNVLQPVNPLVMILWCEYLKKKHGTLSYHIFSKIMFVYVILNIITMILVPDGFAEINEDKTTHELLTSRTYFIGGKFQTAYFNIIFATFFIYVSRLYGFGKIREKVLMALFFSYAVASAVIMKGTTASTILLFFSAFYFLKLPVKLLRNPIIILGIILALSIILLFFQSALLQNDFYLYVVQEVMEKDSDMTGRLDIYYRLSQYLLDHGGLIGVGTSYDFLDLVGAGNLQNEMFQKLFQTGIGGVTCFFLYLYLNMKYAVYNKSTAVWFIGLTALLLAALVEVPFEGLFFIFMAMMPKKYESFSTQQIIVRR